MAMLEVHYVSDGPIMATTNIQRTSQKDKTEHFFGESCVMEQLPIIFMFITIVTNHSHHFMTVRPANWLKVGQDEWKISVR
jgi:hypothetical protein